MFEKKSLSVLVFALGANQVAHANEVRIQNLEISEENRLSPEEYRRVVDAEAALSRGKDWGGSGSYISSGNYASYVSSGNYANYISAGNYADYISAGNYANYISAGNYARVAEGIEDAVPAPSEPKLD